MAQWAWGGGLTPANASRESNTTIEISASYITYYIRETFPTTRLSILAGSSECPHVPVRRSSTRAYLGLGRFPGWRKLRDARLVTRAADGTNRELTLVLPHVLTTAWLAL